MQKRCKELGVGYVDLNGNFLLAHQGVYVDVARPATVFKHPQGVKRVFAGRSRRIIRVLLANPFKPFRLEELASEAELSVGQAFQVTKRLLEDGLLERTSEGRVLTKPRQLLRLFAKELRSDYLENRQVFHGFSEWPLREVAEHLSTLCEQKGIRCAFTLTSGLEPHERNLREDLTAAYIGVAAGEYPRRASPGSCGERRQRSVDDSARDGQYQRWRSLLPPAQALQRLYRSEPGSVVCGLESAKRPR